MNYLLKKIIIPITERQLVLPLLAFAAGLTSLAAPAQDATRVSAPHEQGDLRQELCCRRPPVENQTDVQSVLKALSTHIGNLLLCLQVKSLTFLFSPLMCAGRPVR